MKGSLTLFVCGLLLASFTGLLPAQGDLGEIQKRSYSFKEAGKDIEYALSMSPPTIRKQNRRPCWCCCMVLEVIPSR